MSAHDRLVDAWLAVIGRDGWRGATLAAAAAEAGVSEAECVSGAGDAFDAVAALADRVARAAVSAAAGAGGKVRDRLFDGFMAGFDALQPHRAAVEALVKSRDPGVHALLAARAGPALRRLAVAAGIDATGPAGAARLAALAGLAARALHAWRRDDSADMAGTMAALDRLLAEAEEVAEGGIGALIRRLIPAFPASRDRGTGPAPDPAAE